MSRKRNLLGVLSESPPSLPLSNQATAAAWGTSADSNVGSVHWDGVDTTSHATAATSSFGDGAVVERPPGNMRFQKQPRLMGTATERDERTLLLPTTTAISGSTNQQQQSAPQHASSSLPSPSKEQQDVIHAVISEYCVTVRACAGSGKTTCMLQVVARLPQHRNALIITYNRALADDCKARIRRLHLQHRVQCYTIHGLVSRVSGTVCNDDQKLADIVAQWNKGDMTIYRPLMLDLVMLDEAQDLRPPFYDALSHIFRVAPRRHGSIQLCLVGDPKQLLYDFETYGDDKASPVYMEQPQQYWGHFTTHRQWTMLPLSVSYRLTPHIASFCNLFWGTQMIGGNTHSPNVPVEYLIKYPFPKKRDGDHDKLDTQLLAHIIDTHGPENVMLLAQSVKSEKSPIRVHVNELMKHKHPTTGQQKYNFHIKESVRGFEGTADITNKVRVWTFCGAKGCEADVVIVFGFDVFQRVHTLNQVGVALSRARKRLLVIHGTKYVNSKSVPYPYYPVLGTVTTGMTHTVRYGGTGTISNDDDDVGETTTTLVIPPVQESEGLAAFEKRCDLSREILGLMVKKQVVTINQNHGSHLLPSTAKATQKVSQEMYHASAFSHFSASAEARFLRYGKWRIESQAKERIDYEVNVQFATNEDVSALYGEAVTYVLQWERDGFVPNVETVVSDGILRFDVSYRYGEAQVRKYLFGIKSCEPLTPHYEIIFKKEFASSLIEGKDLIRFLNTRMNLKKKRQHEGGDIIFFRVKALEKKNNDDDEQLHGFLPQIKAVYCAPDKKAFHWVYLANAVMAFSNYHEKFRQIGTNPESYESWVNSDALLRGLARLRDIMKHVPSNSTRGHDAAAVPSIVDIDCSAAAAATTTTNSEDESSTFERELKVEFSEEDQITQAHDGRTIVGVSGVCDWIGQGLNSSCSKSPSKGVNTNVDILEIKFVQQLSNVHRMQVLVYCALRAVERNEGCSGMLYNARTGEKEICFVERRDAMDFLLDISQFKYNGKNRQTLLKVECNAAVAANAASHDRCNILSAKGTDDDPIVLLDISQSKYNGKNRNGKNRQTLLKVECNAAVAAKAASHDRCNILSAKGTDDDPIVLD